MPAGRWEVVWRGPTEIDAELTAGQLRAAGIPAMVEGSQTPYRAAAFPLGGTWLIRVPAEAIEPARALLEEVGEGPNLETEEGGDLLDANQRATLKNQRATLKAAGFGLAVLGIVILLLLIREAAG